jgi:hypothetical protein
MIAFLVVVAIAAWVVLRPPAYDPGAVAATQAAPSALILQAPPPPPVTSTPVTPPADDLGQLATRTMFTVAVTIAAQLGICALTGGVVCVVQ